MANMIFQFLDVGMGDGTLVIMGDTDATQQLALIDFGVQPFTKFKIGIDDAAIYLINTIDTISKARGKKRPYLDHLFITHPDQDHYDRIIALAEAKYPSYKLEDLLIGEVTYGGTKAAYGKLLDQLKDYVVNQNINSLPASAHSPVHADGSVTPAWTFANGNVAVYLLSANYPTPSNSKKNPLSICLLFRNDHNRKVILIGDAEEGVEGKIIDTFHRAGPTFLNAYGLKLGHHGSIKSTSQAWINAVQPSAIFASGDFVWAHPYCKAIKRVIDSNVLKNGDNHWFCCGESGGEYFNNENKLQVCLNLWYVVKNVNGQRMKDEKGNVSVVADGTTLGVQWELDFIGTSNPKLFHTLAANPI
jgi:competence protein ComEC